MCTAIAKKGNDLLYGFNFDVDPAVWNYSIYKTKNYFTVGITVRKTTYFTHGVNRGGSFGNIPYMNGERFPAPVGIKRERLDLMTNKYIRGKYTFEDIERIVRERTLTNIPAVTFHSLIGSGNGDMLIAEPGYGCRKVEENWAVLANFPVLAGLTDFSNPFYGKDRYDRAEAILKNSGDGFSAEDALSVLRDAKQDGQWGTRVSFVYSKNKNTVYYCENGDFSDIKVHKFE